MEAPKRTFLANPVFLGIQLVVSIEILYLKDWFWDSHENLVHQSLSICTLPWELFFFFFPANRLNNTAQCKPRSWVSGTDVSLTDRCFLSSLYSWFAHVQKRWTKHLRTLCVFSSFRLWTKSLPGLAFRRHRGSWPAGPLTGLPLQSEWGLSHPSVSSLGAALWAYWSSVLSHQHPRVALPFSLCLCPVTLLALVEQKPLQAET